MATSSLSNTILDTLGVAVANCEVIIDLIPGPAFKIATGEELASRISVLTDGTGKWTAVLERTGDITPSGTYYRAKERIPKSKGGEKLWYFTVPVTTPTTLLPNIINPNTSSGVLVPFVVTSGTRPGTPFVGQMIFETDTGKILFYYGSTLLWQPAWNTAWGEIAQIAVTSNQTTTGAVYVDTAAVQAFTAINGRRYLATVMGQANLSGGAATPSVGYAITDAANTVLVEYKADLSQASFTVTSPMIHRSSGVESGSVSRKVRIKMATGTGTGGYIGVANGPLILKIEDIGQAAAPVIT